MFASMEKIHKQVLAISYIQDFAVHLAVACDVLIDVSLCCPFSHEMSWMGSGIYLGRFLRVFLPTFDPEK